MNHAPGLGAILHHESPLANRLGGIARLTNHGIRRLLHHPYDDLPWLGFTLRVHPDSTSAAAAYYLRYPDWRGMHFIKDYLRPGDTAVDVGANVGVYTLLMARAVGPKGAVVAFEPDRENFDRIADNLRINRVACVRPRRAAVGAHPGNVRFQAGRDSVGRVVRVDEREPGRTEDVPLVTLDRELQGTFVPYCKVDVEGYEEEVVKGARNLMEAGSPWVWQIEMNACSAAYGKSRKGLRELLEWAGYAFFTYDPEGRRLVPEPEDAPLQDLLAVRDRAAVDARLAPAGDR
jgi:FkbM family methyltransferase